MSMSLNKTVTHVEFRSKLRTARDHVKDMVFKGYVSLKD